MQPSTFLVSASLAVLTASAGLAEPILGVWRTEPDAKGQTGDVRVAPCGAAFCGDIVAAYSPDGAPITTPNVGRTVLLDMAPAGGGTYAGEVFVPIMGTDFPAEVAVSGAKMQLTACNALGVCQSQTWQRVD